MKHTLLTHWKNDGVTGPEGPMTAAKTLLDTLADQQPFTLQNVMFDDPAYFVEAGTGRKLEVFVFSLVWEQDIQNFMYADHGTKITLIAMNSSQHPGVEVKPYSQLFRKVPPMELLSTALDKSLSHVFKTYADFHKKAHWCQANEAEAYFLKAIDKYDFTDDINGPECIIEKEFTIGEFMLCLKIKLEHVNGEGYAGSTVELDFATYYGDDTISLLDFFTMRDVEIGYQRQVDEMEVG